MEIIEIIERGKGVKDMKRVKRRMLMNIERDDKGVKRMLLEMKSTVIDVRCRNGHGSGDGIIGKSSKGYKRGGMETKEDKIRKEGSNRSGMSGEIGVSAQQG